MGKHQRAHIQVRSHIHVLFHWIYLFVGFCGPYWSMSAPALRCPGIILDPDQVLAMSVLAKASGKPSPGPVTRKPINRTCRHLLVTHFLGALFRQWWMMGIEQSYIWGKHLQASLHWFKWVQRPWWFCDSMIQRFYVLAMCCWYDQGNWLTLIFTTLQPLNKQKNLKKPLGFWERKEWHMCTLKHFLVQTWAQPYIVFFFFFGVISRDITL